jgi:excisionase family DNA binding protein
MKTDTDLTHLECILTSKEIQGAQPNRLTAKEAAHRLGVSLSTIYRIDREHGPFRFVLDGRRIFIDQASLELHLANIRGVHADDGAHAVASFPPCPRPATEVQTQPQIAEPMIETFETMTPQASLPASGSGGQRDLIMRARSGPCIITYQSFIDWPES